MRSCRVRALCARMPVTSRCAGVSGPSTPSSSRATPSRSEASGVLSSCETWRSTRLRSASSSARRRRSQSRRAAQPAQVGRAVDVDRAGELAARRARRSPCSMRPSGRSSHQPAQRREQPGQDQGGEDLQGDGAALAFEGVHQGTIPVGEVLLQRLAEAEGERAETGELALRRRVVDAPGVAAGGGSAGHLPLPREATGEVAGGRPGSSASSRRGSRAARHAAPSAASAGLGRLQQREPGPCLGEGGFEAAGERRLAQHLVLASAALELHAALAELRAQRRSGRARAALSSWIASTTASMPRQALATAAARLAVISRKLASRVARKERRCMRGSACAPQRSAAMGTDESRSGECRCAARQMQGEVNGGHGRRRSGDSAKTFAFPSA